MQQLLPRTTKRIMPQREKDAAGRDEPYFRCVINKWDNTYIYATREDNDEEVRINYVAENKFVPGDWTYLRRCLTEGEALNVVRPRRVGDDILPELLIYAPDYLINVTSVANCFTQAGRSPLAELVNRIKPFKQTSAILLGNFAGQLLDEEAYKQNLTYAESMKRFSVAMLSTLLLVRT